MIVLYAVIFQQLRVRERVRFSLQSKKHFNNCNSQKNDNTLLSKIKLRKMSCNFKANENKMLLELSLQVKTLIKFFVY